MKDVIIEGTTVKNHFDIFDMNLFKLLSLNADELVHTGVIKNNAYESDWDKTVYNYSNNIKNKVIEARDEIEIECNVLINGRPLNAKLLDVAVYVYNSIKNAYLSGSDTVTLYTKGLLLNTTSFIDKYIDQVIDIINAEDFEVKVMAPRELAA